MAMHYPKAPIVEAVIELRFAEPHDEAVIAKAETKLSKLYPFSEPLTNVSFFFEVTKGAPNPKMSATPEGHKLRTMDGLDIVMIKPTSFAVSRLAPYDKWEGMFERFKRDWATWKRIADHRKIDRIGMRFINRLDVPWNDQRRLKIEDYLRVFVQLPYANPTIHHYTLQEQLAVDGKENWALTINSGIVPPVLLDRASLLLDLDLAVTNPPQKDDEIFSVLEEMRSTKNETFEAFITDKARELFA